ncbi:hypothetical protein EYF80_065675 [Liparis tanakae]|uniref:Uncharacterized protein n=1 Tax=Liparis tanakae TaxID=230148 RepID=A0A4Z2E7A1_9TELE|nr:hypothetical protein EYF80_065675 [Liparis tanakae]
MPPRRVMSYPGPMRHQCKRSCSLTRTIQTTSSSRPPDKDPIDSQRRPDPNKVEADELQQGPDRQRDNRVPTCNSPPAVRVQDPGQPKHSISSLSFDTCTLQI